MHFQKILLVLSSGCIGFYFCSNSLKIWTAQRKWMVHFWNEQKIQKELHQELPSLLLQLGSLLQAGVALPSALKKLSQSKLGFLFYQNLKTPTENMFSFLNICFLLSLKNGASLSPLLKNISQVIEHQTQLKEKIKIIAFPMKAQAFIAILMPWITLLMFGLITPTLITQSLHSPWGVVGFSTALVLESMAFFWIKRIVA